MNDRALHNMMKLMDDHDKMLTYAEDSDKQDSTYELRPTPQIWFEKRPLTPAKKIHIDSWLDGKDEPKISVILSVFRNTFLGLQLDDKERSDNLLQVSSTDKTSLYCLAHKQPTEMRFYNDMLGLMNMESFVDLHLDKVLSRTQPVMWDQIYKSPSSSLYYHLQLEDWSGNKLQERLAEQTMRYESNIQPLWRTYSLTDLHMLE